MTFSYGSGMPLTRHFTDGDGNAARLRVDVGQTGFFDGREFRTFRRLAMGTNDTIVIKAVVPINVILFGLNLSISDGWADVETQVGGTEGGVFDEVLPIIGRNTMTTAPAYSPQVVLSAGGTLTGGTVIDAIASRSSSSTAQASSIGSELTDERGIGPGTYYFVVTNPGNSSNVGIISARWEERP